MANANGWFPDAVNQGYSTGMTPEAGAIVVWGPGHGYSAHYGHVAYVVAVNGPNSFTVDEANYYDIPGQVDQRRVNTLSDVEGFIY